MSNNTNDEKLKILQERLAQIKEQKETTSNTKEKNQESNSQEDIVESHINQNIEKETESSVYENNSQETKRTKSSFRWLKYFIIIGGAAYLVFYSLNSIKLESLDTEKTNTKETPVAIVKKPLEYTLNLKGQNIALVGTFQDEDLAKSMLENLTKKGFKGDYFFLPNKSNSTDEVYKVFIGPYENKAEANQWTENLEIDFEIITL